MASNDFLECTTALTHFLLEHSDDDPENLHIHHVIDMTEFSESADYESSSPVHVTETPHGYHFKTFVKKCGSHNFKISVKSCSGKTDNKLTWPLEVEFKVHAINESTDQLLSLGNNKLVLNKPKPGVCNCVASLDIEVNIKELKDFVVYDNLILKCTVKQTSCQPSSDFCQSEIIPTYSLSDVQQRRPNLNDHLATLLSHHQLVWESLKSRQFKDEITHIAQTLSDCSQDDKKVDSIECRIDDVDKRIGDVKDTFKEQQEIMVEWMNNVRKEKHNAKEIRERLKEHHIPTSKVQDTTDGQTSSLLSETKPSIFEDLQKSMKRNFLLIGLPGSGKCATGNSILLKKVFKTGPNKSDTDKVASQHATITLSGVPIEITVVISRGDFIDAKAFDHCQEGFDAVLNVVRYDQLFKNNKLYYTDELDLQHLHKRFPHQALCAFGVLVVAGGDMYNFDNADKKKEEIVKIESTQFRNLKGLCQDRVILFDNLKKSQLKQHRQVENLLATINSFQSSGVKFTRIWYGEVMIEDLKEKLSKLHLPQHLYQMLGIAEKFSFLKNYGHFKQLKDLLRIQTSLRIIKTISYQREGHFFVAGEHCDAFLSALSNMNIACLYHTPKFASAFIDLPIFVVMPCTGFSKIAKHTLKNFNEILSRETRDKLILIVTDDGRLNLSKDKTKFIDWCEEQTGFFKDIYQACSKRAFLFHYNIDDVVLRIEQEADLLVFLNTIDTEKDLDIHDPFGLISALHIEIT